MTHPVDFPQEFPRWELIENAPFEQDPLRKRPPDRLLYGPGIGVQKGQVWRWAHGTVASVPHISGLIAGYVTHWMPLPPPPSL